MTGLPMVMVANGDRFANVTGLPMLVHQYVWV